MRRFGAFSAEQVGQASSLSLSAAPGRIKTDTLKAVLLEGGCRSRSIYLFRRFGFVSDVFSRLRAVMIASASISTSISGETKPPT
jgi:hypothetical protein